MSNEIEDEFKRWMAKRKPTPVIDIIQGKTTVTEASETYDMPPPETEECRGELQRSGEWIEGEAVEYLQPARCMRFAARSGRSRRDAVGRTLRHDSQAKPVIEPGAARMRRGAPAIDQALVTR